MKGTDLGQRVEGRFNKSDEQTESGGTREGKQSSITRSFLA